MSQFPNTNNPNSSAPAGSGQLVVVGLVVAVIAVILMNVYVEMRVKASQEETVTFFVFKEDLKEGDEIQMKHLREIEVPKSNQKAFGTNAVPEDPNVPGRPLDGENATLNEAIVKDQMLMFSLFRDANAGSFRDPTVRGLDEITLKIDSKKQTPNLRPGDYVDLRASIPLNRGTRYETIMEYVRVVNLGDRVQDTGVRTTGNIKYGSITIYVEPALSNTLLDVQRRIEGQEFTVTRRDPQDLKPRKLKVGGSKEINEEVLKILGLD